MAARRPTAITNTDSRGTNLSTYTGSESQYESERLQSFQSLKMQILNDEKLTRLKALDEIYRKEEEKIKQFGNTRLKYETKYLNELAKVKAKHGDPDSMSLSEFEKLENKKLQRKIANLKKYYKAVEEAENNLAKANKVRQEAADRVEEANLLKMYGSTFGARLKGSLLSSVYGATGGYSGGKAVLKSLDTVVSGLSNFAKKLELQTDTIAGYKSGWSTRLYGSGFGYEASVKNIQGNIGISPYVQMSSMMKNMDSLVQAGIAYNIEQRAFLQTISENIASTFDAANGTLLQLVRIQRSDSTAARLGMEAGVTSFLNSMYQNNEYMNGLYTTVLGNLYEASATKSSTDSIGFEYQAQKWLGSLYSSGMSSSSVSSISQALGALGSGNLAGMGNMQNLLVMAASRAGLNFSDLLTGGLTANNTNLLMAALVSYLAEMGASGNNVVKSQLSNVFGISMSDLRAAANIKNDIGTIKASGMNYGQAISNLYGMAGTMGARMSQGQLMGNAWENIQYQMAAGMASNPVLYALYKASGMLTDTVGGINIPFVSAMGSGVDLNATVADLMRVGALSGGILSAIGSMMSAGTSGGFNIGSMLNAFGANTVTSVQRGGKVGNVEISRVSYIGNSSDSDILTSSLAGAEEQKETAAAEAAKPETEEKINSIEENIVNIYQLLTAVADGTRSLSVSIGMSDSTNFPNIQ